MNILQVKNLGVKIENKIILNNITFSLKGNESHILFGPNGSGKTTLAGALMGASFIRSFFRKNFPNGKRRHFKKR